MLYEYFIAYIKGMRMFVNAVHHHNYTEASERYLWTLGAALPSDAFSKPQALVAGQHLCEQDDRRRRNIICRDKRNFFLFIWS